MNMNIDNTSGSDSEVTDLIAERDCCGNGCANCVLNVGFRKSIDARKLGKRNIITTYRNFRLISRQTHSPKGEKGSNVKTNLCEVLELQFAIDETLHNAADYFLDIPVGYHVMIRTKIDNGDICLRPYSPYYVDALAMEFKILVNLEPNGHMSRYIKELEVGDTVEFRGPIGAYEMGASCDKARCICIITQGVAISPTIRIVQQILENDEDMSRVFQLACFKDLEHTYFRDKLREFNKYWNYKSRIYLAHQHCPKHMCENGDCTGKCDWLKDNLWYREVALTRRLDELELLDLCTSFKDGVELVFIIAGCKKFQETMSGIIKSSGLEVLDKYIFLL